MSTSRHHHDRKARLERASHPAKAALAAVALHALLLGVLRTRFVGAPGAPEGAPTAPIEIELSLTPAASPSPALRAPDAAASARPPAARVAARTPAHSSAESPSVSTPESSLSADSAVALEPAVQEGPAQGESSAGARPIHLWLDDPANRVALEGVLEESRARERPSVGLLREGLAELDAARGVSRSSAAVPASYQAAYRFAPPAGIAIFELQADATGLVHTVLLSSAPADQERWQQVGEQLKKLLAERRLRVPAGSPGLVTRVRIERGELALDAAQRHRTKRGAAIGQEPKHPREESNESTRASLEPGRLSPTLGVLVAGAAKATPTRVVILSERAL